MEIDSQSDLVIADLRRAAIAGSLGSAPDREAGVLVDAGSLSGAARFVPNPAQLAVAIDGPGLFIFEQGGRTLYSRLGDFRLDDTGRLVDGAARSVMGFRIERGVQSKSLEPIELPADAPNGARYQIDAQGVLTAVAHTSATRFRRQHDINTPIARIAIAIFPVPQRLERVDTTALSATRAAGVASVRSPGEGGSGTLRAHVVAAAAVDIEADLKTLWLLRRKAELNVALTSASDECTRIALGLVR